MARCHRSDWLQTAKKHTSKKKTLISAAIAFALATDASAAATTDAENYGEDNSTTIVTDTTATLSLLALAGLAARRRRK